MSIILKDIPDKPGKSEGRTTPARTEKHALTPAGAPEKSPGDPDSSSFWRHFLGWVASAALAWELVARPIIQTIAPDYPLPEPMIREATSLVLDLLKLCF